MDDSETAQSQLIEELADRDRLLAAFHQVALTMLSSLDLDELLDNLAGELIKVGVFRSLVIALVDESDRSVEVVRSFQNRTWKEKGVVFPVELMDERETGFSPVGRRHHLDEESDEDILLEVARNGEMRIELFSAETDKPVERITEKHREKWGYFIPVKDGDRVLAVLATGSWIEEKDIVLQRIGVMQPLLDQVVIALRHRQAEEALRHESKIQMEEAAIRLKIAEMEQPQDLSAVVRQISRSLKEIGSEHDTFTMQVVDAAGSAFLSTGAGFEVESVIDNLSDFPDILLPRAAIHAELFWFTVNANFRLVI